MGTLDDAIREHLELKRQHGAGEDEIKEAEAEAFGPGEDVPEVPGAAVTAPAGEGDQLDKVFSPADSSTEPEAVEVEAEEAPSEEDAEPETGAEVTAEVEAIEPEPMAIEDGDDAGDALEREREHLLGHPTENYDVDAAIAEEEELDLLSESRLSDELDRALGGPEEIPDLPPEPIVPAPESAIEEEVVGPVEVQEEIVDEGVVEEVDTPDREVFEEETSEQQIEPVSEDPISEDPIPPESDSGEIPLDDTPDFLEDSPDGEDLWFEQKEPKDFDFGD